MDIDNLCGHAVSSQLLSRFQSAVDTETCSHDRQIGSLSQENSLSNLKFISSLVIEYRNCQSSEAEINRSYIFCRSLYRRSRLYIICGADNGHAGNRAHQSDVFIALMGSSILSYGYACMGSSNLHVQMGISHRIAHLLVSAACREHGKCAAERNLSGGGNTCGDRHHIGLCDSAVKETIRERLFEHAGLCGSCQVGIQHYYIGILFAKLFQSVAVALSRCNLLYF